MKKSDYLWCIFFGILAFLSRFPLIEKFQSHWDGPDYSIAVVRYSLTQYTPSPPGYPLYIGLGKFFYLFTHDPHLAMLLVSVFGSILGAIVFYFVGRKIYNQKVGVVASLIFLSGSPFYYFGLTPYAYGLLPGMTALLAYFVYRIFLQKKDEGIWLGIIYGLCFGLRPQEVFQNGFLFLLGFYALSLKEKIKCTVTFFIITLLWVIPLLSSIGGLKKYIEFSRAFSKTAFSYVPISQHVELMLKGFLLSFGIASLFLLYYLWQISTIKKTIKTHLPLFIFYGCWIIPGLFFNLFIRTEHAGYQMSYLSAFVLLIAFALYSVTKKRTTLLYLSLTIVTLFNLFWFFYNRDPAYTRPYRPTSFHYSDIRKNDLKVGSKIRFITSHFSPTNTLIITLEVLWSPYRYYFKKYQLTELSGLDITTPGYVFVRRDAKNWILTTSEDKSMKVVIPPHITTVVFPDDPVSGWIKNIPYKTYALPGKSTVSSISVKPGQILHYGFHEIKLDTKATE